MADSGILGILSIQLGIITALLVDIRFILKRKAKPNG
jgi:hypothetical protein